MVNILTTDGLETLVVAQVVIAIGQAELAGAERGDDHFAVFEVVLAADAEQRRVTEIAEAGDFSDESVAIGDRVDAVELRLNWRDARLIDRRLVHAGAVKIAELLLRAAGSRGRRRLRIFFENRMQH